MIHHILHHRRNLTGRRPLGSVLMVLALVTWMLLGNLRASACGFPVDLKISAAAPVAVAEQMQAERSADPFSPSGTDEESALAEECEESFAEGTLVLDDHGDHVAYELPQLQLAGMWTRFVHENGELMQHHPEPIRPPIA